MSHCRMSRLMWLVTDHAMLTETNNEGKKDVDAFYLSRTMGMEKNCSR